MGRFAAVTVLMSVVGCGCWPLHAQRVEGTASLSGTLTSSDAGRPLRKAQVRLVSSTPNLTLTTVTDSSGGFTFASVPAGEYLLKAWKTASATISADAADGEGVTLTLQPGVSVSGRVDLAGVPGLAAAKLRIRLDIIPGVDHWESPALSVTPAADGGFVFRGVAPGQYRVLVNGLPPNHHVATAVFEGVDASDRNLVITRRENVAGGVISITTRLGSIAGSVTSGSNAPVSDRSVLLFPADRELWVPQSRRIRLVQPNPDGRFSFGELPPGEYLLAALPPPDEGQQFDVEFLAGITSGASAVTLADGQRATHDVRVR